MIDGADEAGPQRRERERESGRAHEGSGVDRSAPLYRGRGEARVRGRRSSLTGGTHLLGEASARAAWLGWTGLNGPNLLFLFLGFSKCFFIFPMVFKSNSNPIQI
jgi:hypothetical protein